MLSDKGTSRNGVRPALTNDADRSRVIWMTILAGASAVFSFSLAGASPFAAIGAASAITLTRRDALLMSCVAWFVNQCVGFAFLHYPTDAASFAWSAALGIVAVLATLAAKWMLKRVARYGALDAAVATLVAAFAVYEGGLFLLAATAFGVTGHFTLSIVARVGEINAVAFAVLLASNYSATLFGDVVRSW